MITRISRFLKKYLGLTIIVSALVGAIFSWGINWILPSRNVVASNISEKKLTCTLENLYPMLEKNLSDNKLQILYNGKPVKFPYVCNISISNTGAYAIVNDDFKDDFFINLIGSDQIIDARIIESTNEAISNEVYSNIKLEKTQLIISDFYLNKGEKFMMQLIVDGKPSTINYHTRISDIGELTLKNSLEERKNDILRIIGIFLLIDITFIIIFIIYMKQKEKKIDELSEKLLQQLNKEI